MDSNVSKNVEILVGENSTPQITYQERLVAKKQNILLRLQSVGMPYLIAHSAIVFFFALITFIGFIDFFNDYGYFLFSLFILTGLYILAGVSTIMLAFKRFYNVLVFSLVCNSLSLVASMATFFTPDIVASLVAGILIIFPLAAFVVIIYTKVISERIQSLSAFAEPSNYSTI